MEGIGTFLITTETLPGRNRFDNSECPHFFFHAVLEATADVLATGI